jgi:menaquinone-9 beta-reductase
MFIRRTAARLPVAARSATLRALRARCPRVLDLMLRVAIVGAGPAGSSAACHLARAGCAVTLVDRARFPRDKVCGDWLTPLALDELARAGLDTDALAAVAPAHTTIRAGVLGAPNGRSSRHALDVPGACVMRRVLDAALHAQALAAGARAEQRVVKDCAHDPALAACDVVVDARGANAGTPDGVGLRAYWTVDAATLGESARSTVTLQTSGRFTRGYGWWFPVSADGSNVTFNVGVGLLAADSRPGHHVTDFMRAFVATQPLLRELDARARSRTRPVGYHVGLAAWRTRVADGRVLRIGDAANLADPLTGDGIGNALRSGRLVAAAIASSGDAAEAARRWQAAYARDLAPDLRIALALRRALQSTAAKNAAAVLLARSAGLRARLHGALFGVTSYRALPAPGRRAATLHA